MEVQTVALIDSGLAILDTVIFFAYFYGENVGIRLIILLPIINITLLRLVLEDLFALSTIERLIVDEILPSE